jgi:hypothetical protein
MAVRHLLYFTAEDHYLYRSEGKKLELEATFAGGDQGLAEFTERLRGQRGALYAVVADLAGEDFHEDQIPLLRGGDREAVLARRLAQRYRDTRLAAALSLGFVAGADRRNERLLLASFTNTQQFGPWLDALEDAGTRLTGVYSIPLIAPLLADKLNARGRTFVVSVDRAGLRQSFVEDGKLRFARLERTGEMEPQALATFARSETLRLAQYLSTLRTLPRDGAPIQVLVVAPEGQRAVFEQTLVSDARLVFRTVDLREATRAAGLAAMPAGAGAEALYLQLAARKAPREQFASREDRKRFFVWQLQRGVVAAGALGFAACALVAGYKWLDVLAVRDRAGQQQRAAQNAANEYQRITRGFPVTHTSTDNLKAAVVEFRRIAQGTASPDAAFAHVSAVLERFPQVEIEAINWSVGKPAERRAAGATPTKPAAPAPAAAPGAEPRSEDSVILEVTGRINATQRNDYRGITAQVQRFAAAFGPAGYEILRTQLPFDITPEGTLTGDIAASDIGGETGEAPRFIVLLAKRLP